MSAPLNTGDSFEAPREADLYPDLSAPTEPTAPTEPQPAVEATEEQKQQWNEELERVEGEIATLKQVLGSKVRYASELKRKLGITPLREMKHDFELGIKTIKDSQTYQKTNETLHDINEKIHQSNAYQKTSAVAKSAAEKTQSVVSGIGSTVSRKLGDLRNSNTFKSVEGKVESAYASVKSKARNQGNSTPGDSSKVYPCDTVDILKKDAKVSGSKSEGSFEDALLSEKEQSANGAAAGTDESLPEEKVPL